VSQTCTRCQGTGFLNLDHVDQAVVKALDETVDHEPILRWIRDQVATSDVQICDCCGDGDLWHGERGEHWNGEGASVYAYNGGLPECH
jgi:hypothetical protein